MSNSGFVSAAPNRSLIEARILALNRSRDFPDKWILKMAVGSEITAEVEFLGDPRGGVFQIHRIKTRS
jgi:hypothetical protein